MQKQTERVVADEEKRQKMIETVRFNKSFEPSKFLDCVGKKLCMCTVEYNVNKNQDDRVSESYEVYEHTKKKDKLLIKQKVEDCYYELLVDNNSTKLSFFDKPKFEFVLVNKPNNLSERVECVVDCVLDKSQNNLLAHKRLNKKAEFVDDKYVFDKDCFFVANVSFYELI